MSLYQTLYFMSLVGGLAGLLSWAVYAAAAAALPVQHERWISDLIAACLLGAFIGGMTVAFSDHWSGNRVLIRWIISGTLICAAAGAFAGLIQIPIAKEVGTKLPTVTRLFVWMLAGSCIGSGLGLRWVHVNRLRLLHAWTGGLVGGALGGTIFAALGNRVPDFSQALGFVFVGVGICFGVTLAPILLRDGILQFVSSGDPRAQSKFGRGQKQWEVQQGDSYVIGSQSQEMTKTAYRREVQVFIPDAGIAPRHAILFGRDGCFYLARHPDAGGPGGLARFVTRVRGKTVTTSRELRDSDDILIGKTALRFITRKREQ